MKMFRWLAAGAVMFLLAALVLWRTSPSQRTVPGAGRDASSRPPVANAVTAPPALNAPQPGIAPSARPEDPLSVFENWARQYAAASTEDRARMLAKGEELARARHAEMARLIRSNPEEAIHRALPYSVRKQLPQNILGLIEHPISARGDFRPLYYKPLPGREKEVPRTGYEVVIDKKRYETHTYGERIFNPAHDGAYLHGVGLDDLDFDPGSLKVTNLMALAEPPARRVTDPAEREDLRAKGELKSDAVCGVSQKPADQNGQVTVLQFGENYFSFCQPGHADQFNHRLSAAHGRVWASGGNGAITPTIADSGVVGTRPPDQGLFKLLYIRVTFADDPISPQSDDGAHATAQNNNRYFHEGSYGTVWWETTITPVIRLPQRKNYYGEYPDTLLSHARAGAAALGYFEGDYFFSYVLCNSLPQYSFGGLSSGILNGSPGAISHELGHNFGLPHANFWQPEGRQPGPIQPRNPAPPFPIDPDSLIGHNDLNAPYLMGDFNDEPSEEYGNQHDVMGSGGGHFSAMFKNFMNWLPDNYVKTAVGSTTNRIYAFDTPRISDGRLYAMRIRKDLDKEYWFSYRQQFDSNPWFSNGIEVDWNLGVSHVGFGLQIGNNVMIDTTPDTTFAKEDAALVVGRTMRDTAADIFVTPIALGGGPNPSDKWIDVVLQKGPFRQNLSPSVSIAATALTITNGAPITFTATAQDPDGDALAYYWDFGDYTFGTNGAVQSKAFNAGGRYVVRCEVSDMKGGVASAHVVITVGTPATFTISGRVLDIFGNPVQGVRVHNSGLKPASPPPAPDGIGTNASITNIGTYRYDYTDSQGYYVIGNIPPGTYTNRAFLFGYRVEPLNFTDPIVVNNGNASDVNFTAFPITRVRIEETGDAQESGSDGYFRIRRFGDTTEDLPVRFTVSGSAILNTDYTLNPATVAERIGQVIIPAGLDSIDLYATPIGNDIGDGNKNVILTLLLQTNETRISTILTNVLITNGPVVVTNTMLVTVTNQFRIPGWELRPSGPNNVLTWYQTYPTYVIDTAEACVPIVDDDPPNIPTVGVISLDFGMVEARNDNATLIFYREGAPLTNDLLVEYTLFGSAANGIDYITLPGKVTIPAGHDYTLVYPTAINDLFVEDTELVQVAVSPSANYLAGGGPAFFLIEDDDLPLVNIFASDSTAVRGGAGGRFTISRAGTLDADLLVNYVVTGTAVSGVDFNTLPGSVVIPAGQLSVDVPVTAIAGSSNSLPRTVTLLLSDSPTYNIYNENSATVTIVDGALPIVTLSTSSDIVNEGGGSASFIITRTGPTNSSLNVFFEVGGSAWEGFDYGAIGTNIVIPAGAASANIVITAINDNAREVSDVVGQETIILQVRAGTNYLLGNTTGRTMRIIDNEPDTAFPAVGFMLGTSSVREDAGLVNLFVKVSANPATNRPIQVEYRVIGGSAVAGVNYINSFPEGVGMGTTGILNITHYTPADPPPMFFDFENGIYTVPVRVLNDGVSGGNKTLTLSLFNPTRFETNYSYVTNMGNVFTNVLITRIPTNAFLGPSISHTLTILDVGVTTVSVAASTNVVFEGGPTANFVVTREGATNAPLTVFFALGGTAANGSDYVLNTTNSVTIPAGTNAAALVVTAIDDPTEEVVEDISVRLLSRPGYSLGGFSAQMFLVSNDGAVQFSHASYEVLEEDGLLPIPVIRSGPTNLAVTVDYLFLNGSATNGVDFLGFDGTLSYAPGEIVQFVYALIIDDTLVEADETFSLSLTNPTGGVQLGGQRTAPVRIVNDDREFLFAAGTFRSPENGGSGEVVILRNGATNIYDTVTFTATNAAAGVADFVPTSVVVEFLPGQTNQSVQVAFLDDDLFEGNEGIALRLSNPSADTQLGIPNTATLLIMDDECKLDFQAVTYSAKEYSNFVSLVVRRVGGTVNPVSVDYNMADVTATNGLDYISSTGTVFFQGDHFVVDTNGSGATIFVPGDAVQILNVPIIDDTEGEGNETFTVTLSNPTGPSPGSFPASTLLGTNVTATVTILDNELAGNVDYEFVAGPNGPVHAVATAPRGGLEEFAGRVVVAGEFTQVDAIVRNRIARLLPNGLLDNSFNPGAGANGIVYAVAVQPDGKVVAAGDFTRMDSTDRGRVARLNADGHIDTGFVLSSNAVNGIVRAVAVQTNGQVIIAGEFTQVNGLPRSRIARLNVDGGLDMSFAPTLDGAGNALVIQEDGRILVGGAFASVNGTNRAGVARLNGNGTLDLSFATGSGFSGGAVHALALQSDGKVVVGGAFAGVNGNPRSRVARLEANGALDFSFQVGLGANAPVLAVAAHSGGNIIIAGEFTSYNGTLANRFARLKSNGANDFTFRSGTGANATVRSALVQTDSAIVIGGDFTIVNEIARNYVARIHGDEKSNLAAIELARAVFTVPENGGFATIEVVRGGNTNVPVTIQYATSDGTASNGADYTGTTNLLFFAPGEVLQTFTVAVVDDILVEGNETVLLSLSGGGANVDLGGLADGILSIIDSAQTLSFAASSFSVSEAGTNAVITIVRGGNPAGAVSATLSTRDITASNGLDYIGFTNTITFTNGELSQTVLLPILDDSQPELLEVLRLQLGPPATVFLVAPDTATVQILDDDPGPGFADTRFDPGAGAGRFVRALALQSDGRLVVGGAFTNFANSNLNFLARLHTNGAVDASFTPGSGPNAQVSGISISPSGHIAIGGAFSNFNGTPLKHLARLTSNGLPDVSFNQTNVNGAVNGVAAQVDGKIIVGGAFSTPVPGFVRLRANGTVDLQFDSNGGAESPVNAVALQSDGKVLVGGAFSTVGGLPYPRLARLGSNGVVDETFSALAIDDGNVFAVAPTVDGRILIGGNFRHVNGFSRSGVARINTDGSLDMTFDPGTGVTGTVYTVFGLADGGVFIGGDFTTVNGFTCRRYALLQANGMVDPRFDSSIGADNTVFASLLTPDKQIFIGGAFTTIGGVPRRGVARLNLGDLPPLQPFEIVEIRIVLNAAYISVLSIPGRSYVLEGSTNMSYWFNLSTNVATGTLLDFIDPNVSGNSQRFYRARLVSP
jgi:uncharacterized delta-60 repeat protein